MIAILQRIAGFFFFIWFQITFLAVSAILVPLAVVVSFLFSDATALKIIRRMSYVWGKSAFWLAFSPVSVQGREKVPNAPLLVISNHQSAFDIMAGAGYYPLDVLFFSKKEVFHIPLFGRVMRIMQFISVDRENPKKAAASLLEAVKKIRKNSSVLLYPEGTRRKNAGEVLDFKPGLSIIARQTKAIILPIVIHGTEKIRPVNRSFYLMPHRVVLEVLDPITPEHPMHPVHESEKLSEEQILAYMTTLVRNSVETYSFKKKQG